MNKSMEKAKNDFLNKLEEADYKAIGEYKGALTKIKIECDKGHEYETRPNDFKRGNRCPICSCHSSNKQTKENAKDNFYNLIEKEGYEVIGEYEKTKVKVEVKCDKGHCYSVTPSDFKQGKRCKICAGKDKKTAELDFIEKLEKENYKLLNKYSNNTTKVKVMCSEGHEYEVKPYAFKQGNRCPYCHVKKRQEGNKREL